MSSATVPIVDQTPQLRPLNLLRDLPAVADLVETCFADTMDAEGRRYVQQMRRAGQDHAFLRWAVTAVDSVSMPLSISSRRSGVSVSTDVLIGSATRPHARASAESLEARSAQLSHATQLPRRRIVPVQASGSAEHHWRVNVRWQIRPATRAPRPCSPWKRAATS